MSRKLSAVEKHFRSIATSEKASIKARLRALQQMDASDKFLHAFLKIPDLHPRLELAATELLSRIRQEAAEAAEKRRSQTQGKSALELLR